MQCERALCYTFTRRLNADQMDYGLDRLDLRNSPTKFDQAQLDQLCLIALVHDLFATILLDIRDLHTTSHNSSATLTRLPTRYLFEQLLLDITRSPCRYKKVSWYKC